MRVTKKVRWRPGPLASPFCLSWYLVLIDFVFFCWGRGSPFVELVPVVCCLFVFEGKQKEDPPFSGYLKKDAPK